jgi:hypothetical protein
MLVAATVGCAAASQPCPACPPRSGAAPCASHAPAPTQTGESKPTLADASWLEKAAAVRIERGRSGSGAAWVVHYDFTRRGDAFQGVAVLTASRMVQGKRQFRSGAIELSIPASAMETFLAAFSRAQPRATTQGSRPAAGADAEQSWWIVDVDAEDSCESGRCASRRVLRYSSPRGEARPSPWYVWASDRPIELDPAALSAACEGLVPQLRDESLQAQIR